MSSSFASNSKIDTIDFDFFENEDYVTTVYNKQKQNDSSKIITKAVIETGPDFPGKATDKHFDGTTEERLSQDYRKQSDCVSSPSSSLEKRLLGLDNVTLSTLMNCLAYNDDDKYDNRGSSSPYSFDLKESSDNSLTGSTVTTITSDFTSISPLSSSSLLSSSCNSLPDDNDENSAVSENNLQSERQTDLSVLIEDLKPEQSSNDDNEGLDESKETEKLSSSKSSTSDCDDNDQGIESQDENSNSPDAYESDFESYNDTKYLEKNCENKETNLKNNKHVISLSDKESHGSSLEDELGDISITQSRSSSVKTSYKKRKNCNLTFSREELMRIERDNLILLKKIMVHSKHKRVSLNQQPFSQKKTSTAINRAKLQKKIEQDNYVSKVNNKHIKSINKQ